MAITIPPELQARIEKLRQSSTWDAAPEELKAEFRPFLGEQDADINRQTPLADKLFASTKTHTFAPTEANVFGDITRPAAAVRNAIMHGGKQGVIRAAQEGLTRPREVPMFSEQWQKEQQFADPTNIAANTLSSFGAGLAGSVVDLATDPTSYVPLAGGKVVSALAKTPVVGPVIQAAGEIATTPFGKSLGINRILPQKMAAEAEEGVRKMTNPQLYLTPKSVVAADVSPNTADITHVEPAPQPVPVVQPQVVQAPAAPIDEHLAYQNWLRQNAIPAEMNSHAWQVPFHPAEEGRAAADALAQRVNFDPNGQGEFNFVGAEDLSGTSPDVFNLRKNLTRKPPTGFREGASRGVQMEPSIVPAEQVPALGYDPSVPKSQMPVVVPESAQVPTRKVLTPEQQKIISRTKAGGQIKEPPKVVPSSPIKPEFELFRRDLEAKQAKWSIERAAREAEKAKELSRTSVPVPEIFQPKVPVLSYETLKVPKRAAATAARDAKIKELALAKAQKIAQKAANPRSVIPSAKVKAAQNVLKKAAEEAVAAQEASIPKAVVKKPLTKEEFLARRERDRAAAQRLDALIAEREKSGFVADMPLTLKQKKQLSYEGKAAVKRAKTAESTIKFGGDTRPQELRKLASEEGLPAVAEREIIAPDGTLAQAPASKAGMGKLAKIPVQKKIDNIVGSAPLEPTAAEIAAERVRMQKIVWDLQEGIKNATSPAAKSALQKNLEGWQQNLQNVKEFLMRKVENNRGSTEIPTPGSRQESFPEHEAFLAKKAAARADKIKNLNLSRFPSEQKAQLRELFAGQESKLETKPITFEQTKAQAEDLFSSPIRTKIAQGAKGQLAAEHVKAWDDTVAKLEAFRDVDLKKNPAAADQVAKVLRDTVIKNKDIESEIARALNANKIKAEAGQAKIELYRKLADQVAKTPEGRAELEALYKVLVIDHPEEFADASNSEIFRFIFRNNLISGVLTSASNAVSGAGQVAVKPLMTALEVVLENSRRAYLGLPPQRTMKEVTAEARALVEGALGKKLSPELRAKNYSDQYSVSPFAKKALFAKTEGKKRLYEGLDTAIGWPERTMKATDDHIKRIAGLMEEAAARARGEDLTSADVIQEIVEGQKRATFQDEMTAIGRTVASVRDNKAAPQWLRNMMYVFQPFIQTPDRIIAGGLKTSWLAPVNMVRRGSVGKYTGAFSKGQLASTAAGRAFDRDAAQMMVAAPLMMGSLALYLNGKMTGAAPQDPKARAAFYTAGKLDNAVMIGNRWVPIRLLPEPMATAMQVNATLFSALQNNPDLDNSTASKATRVAWNTTQMLATKPYLSGMNSLLSTLGNQNAPDDAASTPVAKKVASALVPSIIKDVTVALRTASGQARPMQDNAFDVVQARLPWASKDMVPEVNSFGEDVTHGMRGRNMDAPEYQLLQEIPPPVPDRELMGEKLSKEDFYTLSKRLGAGRKVLYQTLASNQGFMSLSAGEKEYVMGQLLPKVDSMTMAEVRAVAKAEDPMYANKAARTIIGLKKPNRDVAIFPFSHPTK